MGQALIPLTVSWCIAIQAAALGFGLWGLHPLPRHAPRGTWIALAAFSLAILIWTGLRLEPGAWLPALAAALPLGFVVAAVSALPVARAPEKKYASSALALDLSGEEDAGALYFERQGSEKAPVLLVHGAGNDRLFGFWYLVDALLDKGHPVLAAHQPGHGRGGSDLFTLAAARRRLDALVEEARRRRPGFGVVVVGQSLGGSLALDLAARSKAVGRVATISAPASLRLSGTKLLVELKAFFGLSLYRPLAYGNPWEILPAAGAFKRAEFPIRMAGDRPYVRIFAETLAELDLPRRLREARGCPVLLLHGKDDGVIPVVQAHALAESLGESAELKVYPGVSHMNPLFHRKVVRELVDWIGKQGIDG